AFIDLIRIFQPNAAYADGFGHLGEIRILELRPEIEEAARLLLELDETERAVVEDHHFNGQLELRETQEIAHQHGEATVSRRARGPAARERRPVPRSPAPSHCPSSHARTSR